MDVYYDESCGNVEYSIESSTHGSYVSLSGYLISFDLSQRTSSNFINKVQMTIQAKYADWPSITTDTYTFEVHEYDCEIPETYWPQQILRIFANTADADTVAVQQEAFTDVNDLTDMSHESCLHDETPVWKVKGPYSWADPDNFYAS